MWTIIISFASARSCRECLSHRDASSAWPLWKRSLWLLTDSGKQSGRTDRQCGPSRTHIRPVQSQPTLPRICSCLCLSWKLFPDSNITTPEHTVKASQHHLACTLAFHFDYSVLVITGKHNWVEIHCQKVTVAAFSSTYTL